MPTMNMEITEHYVTFNKDQSVSWQPCKPFSLPETRCRTKRILQNSGRRSEANLPRFIRVFVLSTLHSAHWEF